MSENCDSLISCFNPLVDKRTKILILGTLPGPESLATNQYYANKRNSFWRIIYALHNEDLSNEYRAKCKFLLDHEIGVWDVLGYANRAGFEDAAIQNPVPNDFEVFFKEHPQISGLIFNGKEAQNQFRRAYPCLHNTIGSELVLSSSGSLCRTYVDKLESWRKALDILRSKS